MGPYCVILEYNAEAATLGGNVFAGGAISYHGFIDDDFAFVGHFVTGDKADEDGFAAAWGSQEGEAFTLFDGDI